MALQSWIPSTRTTIAIVAVLPIVLPAAYSLYFHYSVVPKVTIVTSRQLPLDSGTKEEDDSSSTETSSAGASPRSLSRDHRARRPVSMPAELPTNIVSFYEHVESRPVPAAALGDLVLPPGSTPTALLTAYSRAGMLAHARTLGGRAIERMLTPELRQTFQPAWVNQLEFKDGDLVNGLYRVVHRGPMPDGKSTGERVELQLTEVAGWDGPDIHGFVVTAVEELSGDAAAAASGNSTDERYFTFTNEVWLWRPQAAKKVFFDFGFGRWIHKVTSGWLVLDVIATLKKQAKSKQA
jgi:hypothetical protein